MSIKRVKVICPGQKLPIRPTPSKNEKEVGYVRSGEEIEIFVDEKGGYFKLVDGRGYLNKNGKNVEWRDMNDNIFQERVSSAENRLSVNVDLISDLSKEQNDLVNDITKLREEKIRLEDEIKQLKEIAAKMKLELNTVNDQCTTKTVDRGNESPLRRGTYLRESHERKDSRKNSFSGNSTINVGAIQISRLNGKGKDDLTSSSSSWEEYEQKDDRLMFTKNGPEKTAPVEVETPDPKKQEKHGIAVRATAIELFNRNLKMFKNKLKEGISAYMWEGEFIIKIEVALKFDSRQEFIIFEQPSRLFGIFTRVDIPALRITEIYECVPGADVDSDSDENNKLRKDLLLTIITKNIDGINSRMIGLELPTLEDRNGLLTGLRTLVSEMHMVHTTPIQLSSPAELTRERSQSRLQAFSPKVPAASVLKQTSTHPEGAMQRRLTIGSADERSSTSTASSTSSTSQDMTSNEDKSENEAYDNFDVSKPIMHGSLKTVKSTKTLTHKIQSVSSVANPDNSDYGYNGGDENMRSQLLIERVNKEKVMIQMLMLTNDLHERDDQIADIKEREEVLEDNLHHLEKLYAQMAKNVDLLTKRLNDAENERDDAVVHMETMKEQLDILKSTLLTR